MFRSPSTCTPSLRSQTNQLLRQDSHLQDTEQLSTRSERNIVVHILEAVRRRLLRTARGATLLAATALRATAAIAAARRFTLITAAATVVAAFIATAALARTQHLHLVGNDLSGVLVLAGLILPFAGADAAFDIDRRALAQVLGCDLGHLAEHRYTMPLGGFLHLAGLLVLVAVGGGNANVGDRIAAGHISGFRVCTQVAHEDDLVYGCHDPSNLMYEVN
ncbi:membrane hypothetical protein [Cupriavidus taiwanensis]|uniref:Uncharacterized protein n=1 Tax=Cupriavidus taiwanensis TaxID=164546 RepID=A0A375JF54_9BURK|nr:membrane hypothetical protein [Cupriavidus taiwanensis]